MLTTLDASLHMIAIFGCSILDTGKNKFGQHESAQGGWTGQHSTQEV